MSHKNTRNSTILSYSVVYLGVKFWGEILDAGKKG